MKKTYLFLVLPIFLVVLAACTSGNQPAPVDNQPTGNPTNNEPVGTTPTASLTLEEVAKYNTPADCWMAIDGQVYDLSPYIKLGIHPGGEKILNGCGQEASAMFKAVEKHQNNAVKNLPNYLLGQLQ